MMPVTPLPAQPIPLPVTPAAPVTLDFTALLQGGPTVVPAPVAVDNAATPVEVSLIEIDPLETDLEPLPAPPPILAMLQPPVQPGAVLPTPIQPDAPHPARAASALPVLSAAAPTAAPTPPAAPTPQEAPSSTPPGESALIDASLAAPEIQLVAIAAPQPRAALPDVPQMPIDTTDPRWIDQMACEIADLADSDGRAKFRLNPETLGSIEVTVRHTADGISVRFEVESESTRTLLAHAEQRLQAEARANGLRIADTQVDLTNQHQQGGREHPAEQPLIAIRTAATPSTDPAERAPASARYA